MQYNHYIATNRKEVEGNNGREKIGSVNAEQEFS